MIKTTLHCDRCEKKIPYSIGVKLKTNCYQIAITPSAWCEEELKAEGFYQTKRMIICQRCNDTITKVLFKKPASEANSIQSLEAFAVAAEFHDPEGYYVPVETDSAVETQL
jgi:hypothetical protein